MQAAAGGATVRPLNIRYGAIPWKLSNHCWGQHLVTLYITDNESQNISVERTDAVFGY